MSIPDFSVENLIDKTPLELLVVIINYKTAKMTCECLESLLPELKDLNSRVVVVDNNSQDNSVAYIQDWIESVNTPKVRLIASEDNGGFAAGNNIGILSHNAENYLLLNSDTIVRSGAIQKLMATANGDVSIGLVSPRLEWLDGKPQESCFNQHSIWSEFLSSAKTGPLTKILKKYVVAKQVTDVTTESEWTSFACIMIRREVFEQIGLLDEGFFMYFEDAEFCYRARKAGWKIVNNPEAHVVHLRGGSSPLKSQAKLRKRLPRYFFESRTRYFYLLYGRRGILIANLLWSLGALIAMTRTVLSRQYQSKIAEKQWRDIWINYLNPTQPYTHPEFYAKT